MMTKEGEMGWGLVAGGSCFGPAWDCLLSGSAGRFAPPVRVLAGWWGEASLAAGASEAKEARRAAIPRKCDSGLMGLLILSAVTAAHGAQPSFVAKPTAARDGETVKISFSVLAPTDVEVAIVAADGKILRHLAAGVLGCTNAPPRPLKPGLEQTLVWDGKDDLGRPAASVDSTGRPSAQKVRVSLSTSGRLGKVLFDERGIAWSPRAATVGPDGLVYVLEEHAQAKSTFLLEAYTQEGKYVKTVMPYPANLPPERLGGLPRTKLPDGRWLPIVQHAGFRDLYPESTGMRAQRMPITSKGWIVLVNAAATHNSGNKLDQRLLVVDTDGGTPRGSYLGPPTSAERRPYGLCWVALSPDERWIYTSGQLKDGSYDDGFGSPPHQVVYRVGWDDKDQAKPFIGELHKAGNDETHFNAPRGIDTDAQGRLYVCDWGNNRVAVFDAEGKWVGKIDVEAPDQVGLDRKTGAMYVLTVRKVDKAEQIKLVKFPGIGKAGVAEVNVGPPYCTLSVDSSGKDVNIWLARTFGEAAAQKRGVEKVEDRSSNSGPTQGCGTLSPPVEVIKHRTLTDAYQIAASMVNDDVFIHGYSDHVFARVDGKSGEVLTFPKVRGHDVGVGPNGEMEVLLMSSYSPSLVDIYQYDRDGNPVSFAGGTTNFIRKLPGNKWGHGCTGSKGFSVSPRGDIVVIGALEKTYGLLIYGPDGKLKDAAAVKGLSGTDGSPMMDLAGNLYVAAAAKRPDEIVPKPFDSAKPPGRYYPWMYGSVIKFPPSGGSIYYKSPEAKPGEWPPTGAEKMMKLVSNMRGTDALAQGALWSCGGFTVTPASNWSVGGCGCYTSRFGLDYFGRVYIPDVGQFAVRLADSAGNEIVRFGDYGNADSGGQGSRITTPSIPLAWPLAVSAGKSGVYVSDFINRRILRVDLVHAAEATCEIR